MYRLIYWSQSTIPAEEELLKLREILTEAMRFNQMHDLTGVLYFGQGYFMQCLEGSQQDVDYIYEKIKLDPRHQSVTTMLIDHVEFRQFNNWEMSFIRQKSKELAFFKQLGFDGFEPSGLTHHQLNEFLNYLYFESIQDSRQIAAY